MPKNRNTAALSAADLEAVEASNEDYANEYVLFSGDSYRARKTSGRKRVIDTVRDDVLKPVSLATFLGRAANLDGKGKGYPPPFVLSGIALHAGAKPSVLIRLRKDAEGNFVALSNVPTPGAGFGIKGEIKEGDIIIASKRAKALGKQKGAPSK